MATDSVAYPTLLSIDCVLIDCSFDVSFYLYWHSFVVVLFVRVTTRLILNTSVTP